jgi:hypothetical protein
MALPPFRIAVAADLQPAIRNLIFANHRDFEFPVGFVTVHIS